LVAAEVLDVVLQYAILLYEFIAGSLSVFLALHDSDVLPPSKALDQAGIDVVLLDDQADDVLQLALVAVELVFLQSFEVLR